MIEGPAFVTPHALRQFQARVASLPDDQARAVILAGLRGATRWRRARDGAVRVRVRRPYPFRAGVAPSATGGALPAVVTILRSGR